MGRQQIYPDYYPTGPYATEAAAAWDFLLGNQARAAEACIVWLHSEFDRVGRVRMARNVQKSNNKAKIEKADWKGYANVDLSPEDKQAIRGGILDGESVLEIIGEMLGTGHKVALTYDREKDTVTAAATGVYTYCKNAGYTLTCFGRSLASVLEVLAYKHEVVTKGDWSAFISRGREYDDIG